MTGIRRIDPQEAYREICANPSALLIDVRDPTEFAFVGHPLGAINIPLKFAPRMEVNPGFLSGVQEHAEDPSTALYLLCRSGQRSFAAAEMLQDAGYVNVVNIEQGFEGAMDADHHRSTLDGWRFHGLPWKQS